MRILLAAALVALPSATAWAQNGSKHVLVLYSTRQDAPISIAGAQLLPRLLDEGLQEELAFYAEYIDQGRFPDAGYQAAFGDFLRVKYKGQPPDLVVAAGYADQRLYVMPSLGLVVVRLGTGDRKWSDAAFLARLLDGIERK